LYVETTRKVAESRATWRFLADIDLISLSCCLNLPHIASISSISICLTPFADDFQGEEKAEGRTLPRLKFLLSNSSPV